MISLNPCQEDILHTQLLHNQKIRNAAQLTLLLAYCKWDRMSSICGCCLWLNGVVHTPVYSRFESEMVFGGQWHVMWSWQVMITTPLQKFMASDDRPRKTFDGEANDWGLEQYWSGNAKTQSI